MHDCRRSLDGLETIADETPEEVVIGGETCKGVEIGIVSACSGTRDTARTQHTAERGKAGMGSQLRHEDGDFK